MMIHWFVSRTVRRAVDMSKHVWKILNSQRDLLSPEAVEAVEQARQQLRDAVRSGADKQILETHMTQLEEVANRRLKPYPHAGIRENVEVFLVALAVAMSIRTFFLQPFKIPTGSMQPTLYGITHEDLRDDPEVKVPTGLKAFVASWVYGITYTHVVARADGNLQAVEEPRRILPFVKKQRFRVGDEWYTVWFPPDQLFYGVNRSGLRPGQYFRRGEDIIKLRVKSGDHLFVDRLTYNFRRPIRGEIIVFETKGIRDLQQDLFYIKRMVAKDGERVRIGDDQHLIVNGLRLDASTPRFENVYTFEPTPKENHYFGHVNQVGARRVGRDIPMPYFPDSDPANEFTVRPDHYLAMGDNTLNSYDSRGWGDVPENNLIGKACFVYWPISERFGWAYR